MLTRRATAYINFVCRLSCSTCIFSRFCAIHFWKVPCAVENRKN